jgi:hypothetical protein
MIKPANQSQISQDRLTRQMSDVISLRERVAQAELAARSFGIVAVAAQSGEPAESAKLKNKPRRNITPARPQ